MKFELEKIHRNTSENELIDDMIRVANILTTKQMSRSQYDKHGKYTSTTYINRFDSWSNAVEKAGISEFKHRNFTREELLQDLLRVASDLNNKRLSRVEYVKHGKYSFEPFKRVFGSWANTLKTAGIVPRNYKISIENCFENIENVWTQLGRQPRYSEMKKPLSKYSGHLYSNKFGTWTKALEAFVEYINTDEQILSRTDEKIKKENPEVIQSQSIIINHKTKREVNWRLRFLVMRRDNFKCVNDGFSPATHNGITLHVDHKIPWSKGGETVFENLQTLCSVCNIGKGDLDMGDV